MNRQLLLVLLVLGPAACGGGVDDTRETDTDTDTDTDADADADTDTDVEPECTDHDDCRSDEFCYGEECEKVNGRWFTMTFFDAVVETTGPDGSWDAGGGAPDPYIWIDLDGETWSTSADSDTFYPEWNESVGVLFDSTASFTISMWDDDTTDDDIMLSFDASGLDTLVDLVRIGDISVSNSYVVLNMSVEPDF